MRPQPRAKKLTHERNFLFLGVLAVAILAFFPAAPAADNLPFPLLERFESFGIKDGFPTHKVHCVLPASDGKLWVGTWKGLMVRENGAFKRIGVEEGLSHQMVVCLAEDPRSGDMWIGTMRGLNRYSAGRITVFTQTVAGCQITSSMAWRSLAIRCGWLRPLAWGP